MIEIWKFELGFADSQIVKGPDLIPLSVGVQKEIPCLWGTVNTDEEEAEHEIIMYGAGHRWTHNREDLEFLGTFQLMGGRFVQHVFVVVA